MNDDWFDELAENEGIDGKDLSKDYDKIYKKLKPVLLKTIIKGDNVVSNVDIDIKDFYDIEFNHKKKPDFKYKNNGIYIIDKHDIVLIDTLVAKSVGEPKRQYTHLFYVYEMKGTEIIENELHMFGWDYNVIYNFTSKDYKQIYVR